MVIMGHIPIFISLEVLDNSIFGFSLHVIWWAEYMFSISRDDMERRMLRRNGRQCRDAKS